jgi:hypothetical protein
MRYAWLSPRDHPFVLTMALGLRAHLYHFYREERTAQEQADERFYEAELWRLQGELVLQSEVRSRKSKSTKQKARSKERILGHGD